MRGGFAAHEFERRAPGLMSEEQTFEPVAPLVPVMPPPPSRPTTTLPPRANRPSARPATAEQIVEQQRTKRSSVHAALRSLQRGVIPGYDDTHEPGGEPPDDTERGVVIDRTAFNSLLNDSGEEYQAGNRPTWAPRVPNDVVEKIKTWIAMDTLSELQLRSKSWYSFMVLVAGAVRLPISALVIIGPQTASAQAVRPTSTTVGAAPVAYGESMAIGAGGTSDAMLRSSTTLTPFRPGDMGMASGVADVAPAGGSMGFGSFGMGAAAPSSLAALAAQQRDRLEQQRRQASRMEQYFDSAPSAPPIEPVLSDNDAIYRAFDAIINGVPPSQSPPLPDPRITPGSTPGPSRTIFTDARFKDLRKQAEAQRTPAWYESSSTPEAAAASMRAREAGARALPWINRSVATGIYYLNPFIVTAREFGYTNVTTRASHLSHVAPRHFMDDVPSDAVQRRVRAMFAKVVAAEFNMLRHNSANTAKLASDAANIAAESDNAIEWFVNRITFNSSSGRFCERAAECALNRLPMWQRDTVRRAMQDPGAPAQPCYDASPLVVRSRGDRYRTRFDIQTDPYRDDYSFDTLIRVPGTIYTSTHQP